MLKRLAALLAAVVAALALTGTTAHAAAPATADHHAVMLAPTEDPPAGYTYEGGNLR